MSAAVKIPNPPNCAPPGEDHLNPNPNKRQKQGNPRSKVGDIKCYNPVTPK